MDSLQQRSVATTRAASPVHWHFRAMPPEVQRGAIRRLALSGLSAEDIAARTGWSVDSVRHAILEDECVRRLALPTVGSESRRFHVVRNGSFTI
jgi:hypothetical protein